jgi:carboxyl-terminal processing protease
MIIQKNLSIQAALAVIVTLAAAADAQSQTDVPVTGAYTYTLDSPHFGTLEGQVQFETTGNGAVVRTPQYELDFNAMGNGTLRLQDGREFEAALAPNTNGYEAIVTDGLLRGSWQFRTDAPTPERDYPALVTALNELTENWLYDPRLMQTPAFTAFQTGFSHCAETAIDDAGLVICFDNYWDDTLFSHFEILRPLDTMDGLLAEADAEAEDRPVARYEEIETGIALVSIDSFFGIAIEEQIDAAMTAAIQSGAHSLIIDLRENGGGTSAAIPVAARIIEHRQLMGVFIANTWWRDNDTLPDESLLTARPPLNGREQGQVMGELVSTGYTAASLDPADAVFTGNVYVLTSRRTASASEALVGMIKMTGRATLVGETTAGEMLSSSFFPLPFDFSLRLPVADFYLSDGSRIDGAGVVPHIDVTADQALDWAIQDARTR